MRKFIPMMIGQTEAVRTGNLSFFEVEGQRLNAWQTVNYYCEKITAAGYTLEKDYTANFAVFNESSEENIFVIPMSKTLYTNQFICLFRSRHYNHAKAYGLSGENGSSATKRGTGNLRLRYATGGCPF